ncbi:MAG: 5'/3'-nucleotidase SurE [Elusimicrobia bacterium]|nr:5'/3'-nucleotidase SurE [Elusimicrobiota bacterium]
MKTRILVVNDDGINGRGLAPLIEAVRPLGEVVVVVPDQERSADSHSLTLHKPIRIHRVAPMIFTLNGSPADCARLGILEIMNSKVSLVVSGINRGYNLGEDVVYSGTVAGAREATLLEVPAIAFSQDPSSLGYAAAVVWARKLARLVLKFDLPPGICLNVNFPKPRHGNILKPLPMRLGRRIYSKEVTKRADPRGGHYYWLAGSSVKSVNLKGTDVSAVASGHASVTPLHVDNTDFPTLDILRSWEL